MTTRRGFALVAVLAALIVTSLVVAITARRALAAARQGALELARVELAAALTMARASALWAATDSAASGLPPGVTIAEGEVRAGSAAARWTLSNAAPPYVVAELRGSATASRGTARSVMRALLEPVTDSSGGAKWRLAGGAGWVRLPAP